MASAIPLVDLEARFPELIFDLKYATADNISGKPIYKEARCLLHPKAAECLERSIELAHIAGYRLRIFDAYRPQAAQYRLWEALPDPSYVMAPTGGSNHSRGVAIDLNLVDSSGHDLDMGTGFDDMSTDSHPFTVGVDTAAQRNRLQLHAIMIAAGFIGIPSEWWHFELPHAESYPLIDDQFECY